MIDEFSCAEDHLAGSVGPSIDDGREFGEGVFCREQKGKDILRGCAFGNALEKGLAELGIERGEFLGAPTLTKETDDGTTSTTLEMRVFDIVFQGELEDTGGTACTLSAAAAPRAPFALCEALVFLKRQKSMEKAMKHFVGDASLNFVMKGRKRKIQGSFKNGKCSREIIGTV